MVKRQKDDVFSDMMAEAEDASAIPDEAGSSRLRKLGKELIETDLEITELEDRLKTAKTKRDDIAMVRLPEVMLEIGQDSIGMPGFGANGADLVLEPYTFANIAADWEPDRRKEAFRYVDMIGGGDMIKNEVTFLFGRGDHNLVKAFLDSVSKMRFEDIPLPEPTVKMAIPWNTLTAFVKEQVTKQGKILDLPKLGATVGQVVKIKYRKER